jgi:hypothetical protein
MFSIDLLKGKGLPEKALFASAYQRDRALLQHQHETLTSNRQQLELHTNDVIEFNKINRTIKGMEKCLHDISKAMNYRVQVSEVFVELVQTLPESIFVYEMNLERKAAREKKQLPDSGEVKQQLVVRRKLDLVLCGYDADQSDAAVQEYVSALKLSPLLKDLFTEIKPPARQQGEVDGRAAIYYEIECILREQGS